MSAALRSKTAKALSPALLVAVLNTVVTQLYSSGSPSPVLTPTKSGFQATPIIQDGTPFKSIPSLSPTPTTPTQTGFNTLLLISTIFVCTFLSLAVLVLIPCALFSQRRLNFSLWHLVPSVSRSQLILSIITFGLFYTWPCLQEYPTEEIVTVILGLWRDHYDWFKSPTSDEGPCYRVVIVLERRSDKSQWVIEFNQPTPLFLPPTELGASKSQTLTTDTTKTLDMAAIQARFASARDLAPSAPWRVLGYHDDFHEASSSYPTTRKIGRDRLLMYPLGQEHATDHFSYSQSHDPKPPPCNIPFFTPPHNTPFWSSSAESQVLAWSLIEYQSRNSLCGAGRPLSREFYDQFGVEPYISDMKLAIEMEEQAQEKINQERWAQHREVDRIYMEEMSEKWRVYTERARRRTALMKHKMRRLTRGIKFEGLGWKEPRRLRPRRNLH